MLQHSPRSLACLALVAAGFFACSSDGESVSSGSGGGPVITGVGGSTGFGGAVSSSSAVQSSSSSASSGASGGAGGGGGNCSDAVFHEPNEAETTAFKLKNQAIDECDSSGDSISGTIAGDGDVDWFYFEGSNDDLFCTVDPARSLTQSESGIRVCKYFECWNGIAATDLTCPGSTTNDTSPEGRPGCCAMAGFTVDDVQCTSTVDDSMFVYIRLDQPGATASTCNAYTLDYHF